jgi:hypothetical protein
MCQQWAVVWYHSFQAQFVPVFELEKSIFLKTVCRSTCTFEVLYHVISLFISATGTYCTCIWSSIPLLIHCGQQSWFVCLCLVNYDLLISLISASAFYLFTDIIDITRTVPFVLELKNIIHCEFSSSEMNYIQAIDKSCGCFSEWDVETPPMMDRLYPCFGCCGFSSISKLIEASFY